MWRVEVCWGGGGGGGGGGEYVCACCVVTRLSIGKWICGVRGCVWMVHGLTNGFVLGK